jgi:transcriptional regulator
MHIPSSFSETDPATLLDFIERHNFGLLIWQQGQEPLAIHLPLLLDRQAGPSGSLVGHMARC